jgi:hypothetical protein
MEFVLSIEALLTERGVTPVVSLRRGSRGTESWESRLVEHAAALTTPDTHQSPREW